MTVVSSKEFVSNHNKYFGLAMQGPLFIRRGGNVFQVSIANGKNAAFKKPDDDFCRAITAETLLEGICEDIDKKFTFRSFQPAAIYLRRLISTVLVKT